MGFRLITFGEIEGGGVRKINVATVGPADIDGAGEGNSVYAGGFDEGFDGGLVGRDIDADVDGRSVRKFVGAIEGEADGKKCNAGCDGR